MSLKAAGAATSSKRDTSVMKVRVRTTFASVAPTPVGLVDVVDRLRGLGVHIALADDRGVVTPGDVPET
jgi:hypothetical protein